MHVDKLPLESTSEPLASRQRSLNMAQMGHLRKVIYDYHDGVMSDDVPNITLQARLIELVFYYHNRLVTAKVAGKTFGMTLPSELIPERCVWDAQPILKE